MQKGNNKKERNLGKVAIKRKFRRGKKRHKNCQSELTKDFDTPEPRSIIRKMKIPLLILCLAVVYGACQTYNEENYDLTEKTENGDYKLDMPLERFLSRHRRASLSSPITTPINLALRLAGFDPRIISTAVDSVKIIFGALMGQDCPKVKNITIDTLVNIVKEPIKTIQTVLCYAFHAIGVPGRALMKKMFEISFKIGSQFFIKVFVPGLHTTLLKIRKLNVLPPQINGMIDAFDALYKMSQLLGIFPK